VLAVLPRLLKPLASSTRGKEDFQVRVSDPHLFHADPDPEFQIFADPDLGSQTFADPDPGFEIFAEYGFRA